MIAEDKDMVSVSHWGLHERKPIEVVRKPNPFERCFPYPTLQNKDEFRAYFLDIKA
jgi:hypothetical protein